MIDKTRGIKVNRAAVHLIALERLPSTKATITAPSSGRKIMVVR
jgi:hypothetical protein